MIPENQYILVNVRNYGTFTKDERFPTPEAAERYLQDNALSNMDWFRNGEIFIAKFHSRIATLSPATPPVLTTVPLALPAPTQEEPTLPDPVVIPTPLAQAADTIPDPLDEVFLDEEPELDPDAAFRAPEADPLEDIDDAI